MKSEFLNQIIETIETRVRSRPSAMEFDMAYQARIALDRIKFAIKLTERAGGRPDQIREAGMLLLDALDRLDSVERRFQERSRTGAESRCSNRADGSDAVRNGDRGSS